MIVLVTGAAGYIGTHTVVELLDAGHDVVALDSFCNSYPEALERVEQITGKSFAKETGDIRNIPLVEEILKKYGCDAVIHFAGLKAIADSNVEPLEYYDCNILGTYNLLQAMVRSGVKRIVFSSSAAVYGVPVQLPIVEEHPLLPTNPYGRTKMFIEHMLGDLWQSDQEWKIAILRYFNPAGAHKSGLLGEYPKGAPKALVPIIGQVASGKLSHIDILGDDYPTPDGTGIRDYIHVVDLAKAHLHALASLTEPKCLTVNVGTGTGYSVMDVIKTFEHVSNRKIEYDILPRRRGDVAVCYSDPSVARKELNWTTKMGLREMCEDAWNWHSKNPNGYQSL